uniref:hypothetical protein n=1 Tax=Flavobacterium sp. TaxID=239 RepID=UPI0037C057EB
MIITYLKLENYKRFPLSHVEVFEKEFKNKMTVITGPNGSGKSSLISELTPLPTSKDNFFENGYKEIHIDHKDQQYRLVCDFRGTSKFYFYLNDQNLNLSHNVTMQKDLAYQHFGITPVIHDLLTGKETFTEMSLLGRKKLIHAITHLNIDTIIDNYEKLKEDLKNFDFLQKTLTSQLVMEKHKLADTDAVVRLKEQLCMYHQHIDHMLNVRQEIYRYAHGTDLTVTSEALRKLEDQKQKTFQRNYVYLTSYSYSGIQSRLNEMQASYSLLDANLRTMYEQLERLEEEKKTFSMTNNKNIDDLRSENKRIDVSIERRVSGLVVFKDKELRVEETLSALQILEAGLPEVLETLPANPDRQYSKVKYNELLDAKNKLLSSLNSNLQKLSRFQAELSELQNHKELNCPSCHHSWLPAEVDGKITELTESIKSISSEQAHYQFAVQGIDKDLTAQSDY